MLFLNFKSIGVKFTKLQVFLYIFYEHFTSGARYSRIIVSIAVFIDIFL